MREKVIQILAEIKNDESLQTTLTGSSDIIHDVGLDSLQMINFVLRIEDEFGVEIDFEEFDYSHLNAIDIFCEFVSQRM